MFFRDSLLSGLAVIPGDRLDARMILYLHEHLFQWLLGNSHFLSPAFYYPQQDVLGYSDAFLLDLLPFSALRLLGFDPYLSMLIMIICLSLLSFASLVVIFKKYLRMGLGVALCGAVLATFPNNLYFKTQEGHLQFIALYYVPAIVLLALWSLDGFPRITLRSILGTAAAWMLFALLFSTSFYAAWMFAFTASFAAISAGIASRYRVVAYVESQRRAFVMLFGAAVAGFVAGLLPLALIYAPALQMFHGRPFQAYLLYAPVPTDIFNVSAWNIVWGWLVDGLLGSVRARSAEHGLAVTPGVTVIFLVFLLTAARSKSDSRGDSRRTRLFTLGAVSVYAGAWLLTLKIGTVSGFWIVFHTLPGATAIRAGDRMQLIVNLWVASAFALLIDRWIAGAPIVSRNWRRLLAGTVLLFCMVEQLNDRSNVLARAAELSDLRAVPMPPLECRSFLVKDPTELGEVDAMWISLKTGLPTLNGRSGWSPPGWHLGDSSIGYTAAARQWIAQNKLSEQVCLYDEARRGWSRFEALPARK